MGLKKFLRNTLASLLIAGSAAMTPAIAKSESDYYPSIPPRYEPSPIINYTLPSDSESKLSIGLDSYIGCNTWKIKSPNKNHTLTFPGSDEVYTQKLSESFYNMYYGFAPFIGYSSGNAWLDFKIGKEFNYYKYENKSDFGKDKYLLGGITRNNWGEWPNLGVYAEVEEDNLFFIEKTLFKYPDDAGACSLIMKLNKYKVDYTSFTARTPYGDEWSEPISDTVTGYKDLEKREGTVMNLGLRSRVSTELEEIKGVLSLFLELSYGIPLNDYIEPKWDARASIGLAF